MEETEKKMHVVVVLFAAHTINQAYTELELLYNKP